MPNNVPRKRRVSPSTLPEAVNHPTRTARGKTMVPRRSAPIRNNLSPYGLPIDNQRNTLYRKVSSRYYKDRQNRFVPLQKEILVLPPNMAYFGRQQRPSLLMDAFARQGWTVNWPTDGRKHTIGKEHKEENVHLLGDGAALRDAASKGDNIKWLFNPYVRLCELDVNQNGLTLFDYLDDFPQSREVSATAITDCDVVFCSAEVLLDKALELKGGRDAFLLPNGVDYHAYEAETRDPEDFYKGIPHPRIGYMGALAYWIDWDLIQRLIRARPGWSIVLIGFKYGINEIPITRAYPNLFEFGEVHYHDLPVYLKGLDVGIIPFSSGPIADACNPCKLYQYWAAGKPVVATNMRELREIPTPLAYTTANSKDFICAIEDALEQDVSERCKEEAKKNTWDIRAETAAGILNEYYELTGSSAIEKEERDDADNPRDNRAKPTNSSNL